MKKMATRITSDVCKYPDCTKPRYREITGRQHDFCGQTHAHLYRIGQMRQHTSPSSLKCHYDTKSAAEHNKTTSSSVASPGAGGHSSSRHKPLKAVHGLMSLPTYLPSLSPFHSTSSNSSSKPIKFYNWDEPYYEFTNFFRAPVVIDGKRWPTTEHYFQSQKFVGTPYVEVIRRLPTAREAFQLSHDPKVSRWRRSDWDAVKDGIMLKALRCKFAQHQNLREKLWKTGERDLIEHTTNDSYWADGGGEGKGQNRLGKLLMTVRKELIEVIGPYKPPSSRTSGLKRWSSLSDLSADYIPKKPNSTSVSTSLKGTTLKITRNHPRLRWSSSTPRINYSRSDGTVDPTLHSKRPEAPSASGTPPPYNYPPCLQPTYYSPTPPPSSNSKSSNVQSFYRTTYTGSARSHHQTNSMINPK